MAIKVSGTTVIDDSRNLTNVGTLSSTGSATIVGNLEVNSYKGKLQNLGTVSGTQNINIANGDNINMTLGGATTINVTGLKSSAVNTFTLIITNPGLYALTILSGILTWDKGLTPVLPSSGKTVLVFESYDNGANWIGAQVWRYPA